MKRIFTFALCAVAAAALLTGCEWSSSSEHNESWNDSYNWVNFSGTYRSAAGGILVTDYTSTPLVPGTTNNYNTTESGGTLPGGVTTGSGTTQKKPITPGSFSLVIGEITLSDNGAGVLSGNGGSGTVSYAGGTWSFKLDGGSSSSSQTTSESGGTLPAKTLAAGGTAKHGKIVPKSFTIKVSGASVGTVTMSDDGDGKLVGTGVKAGSTVDYSGGSWQFTLEDTYWDAASRGISLSYTYTVSDVSGSRNITVRYGYQVSNTGGSGGGARPGSTGKDVYAFVLAQQGQKLTITDSNGAVYKGRISGLRSASGISPTNTMPRDGDTIIGSFSTEGTSAAGMQVTIAGTLQGTVSGSVFTGRTMQGTWIEKGGKTGDINATTTAVAIPASSASGTTDTTTTTPSTTTSSSTSSSSSSSSGSSGS